MTRRQDETTGERDWEKELKLELTSGLSYRVAPGWYAGVEGRYASVYPNWTSGFHREFLRRLRRPGDSLWREEVVGDAHLPPPAVRFTESRPRQRPWRI